VRRSDNRVTPHGLDQISKMDEVSHRGGVVPIPPRSGGSKWRDKFPEESDHLAAPLIVQLAFFESPVIQTRESNLVTQLDKSLSVYYNRRSDFDTLVTFETKFSNLYTPLF